jgi:hypothetical protein
MYTPLPDEADSENDIADWPRRLLHVPTMTVYEWKPGHRYGSFARPKYNALSYTWGRYALRDSEKCMVQSVKINGTTWTIPRIDPDVHFSKKAFEKVIKEAVKDHMSPRRWSAPVRDLKFLWLDIACIDQTFPRWATLEIGRQAMIFGKANRVYVWLSHLSTETLQECTRDIFQASETAYPTIEDMWGTSAPQLNGSERSWVEKATHSMTSLLADPYFSSLWTLQEGYLCSGAMLMSKEGEPVSKINISVTLSELAHAFGRIQRKCVELLSCDSDDHASFSHLAKMVDLSGISFYRLAQPMVLYRASRHRRTTYAEDRIYGIQQVFGFQLGRSDPDAATDRVYTLEELEDQLGKKLVETWPSMSQLFVHSAQVPTGRGWHMTDNSIIPSFGLTGLQISPGFPRACTLSTMSHNGATWGFVQGLACTFSALSNAWRELYGYKEDYDVRGVTYCHRFALDEELRAHLPGIHTTCPPAGKVQHDIAKAIENFDIGLQLRVMLLDAIDTGGEWANYYGVIVILQKTQEPHHWHRLGVCQWITLKEFEDNSVVPFLQGIGTEWREITGLYT